jgi:hypothetical protein
VASVTTAATSLSDDLAMRTRRYLWTMGIRTVCFVGAIVVPGWPRWVLIAGAVLLPYLGVVGANAGREKVAGGPLEPVSPDFTLKALPAAEPVSPSQVWEPTSDAGPSPGGPTANRGPSSDGPGTASGTPSDGWHAGAGTSPRNASSR